MDSSWWTRATWVRNWQARDLETAQARRERRVLLLSSGVLGVLGCAWALVFATHGQWLVVGLDAVLIACAVASWGFTLQGQHRKAFLVLFTVVFFTIVVMAAVLDIPSEGIPRSTHLYLLPLALAAMHVFRNEPSVWVKAYPVAVVVSFVVLHCWTSPLLAGYALAADIRAQGTWVQALFAMGTWYGIVRIVQSDASVRSDMEDALHTALLHQQFELYYQAQTDVHGQVVGAEALIRWHHPSKGLVMPGEFIALAEETGLIRPMGLWTLQVACAQLEAWASDPVLRTITLAVNISAAQFRHKDFLDQVVPVLERHAVRAGMLKLEITESMLAQDLPDMVDKMCALQDRGVLFSLDDFGTGYSSLNYLKRMPLSQLKVDQAFVRDVLVDPHDAAIAKTIIALGKSFEISVLAEGVETSQQLQFLLDCGCPYFQGYLFSRPVPLADFEDLVRQRNARQTAWVAESAA